jgi:AAA family ATP:ADP antiporter
MTLFLQLVILPLGLKHISERSLHLFIPISYMACLVLGLGAGAGTLLTVSSLYIFMKASDYSLFSSAKELLYHPLRPLQKYGAKYLTDMIVYRAAKASIAVVLLYFQAPVLLNGMMVSFMGLWLVMVIITFRQHRKLFA